MTDGTAQDFGLSASPTIAERVSYERGLHAYEPYGSPREGGSLRHDFWARLGT